MILHVVGGDEFELTAGEDKTRFYSLIKYDYREAIEQTNEDDQALLRRIVSAFIADKKAIQKSALIRIENGIASKEIAARDRAKQAPDIGDYFANFLHVTRVRNNEQLTKDLMEAVRKILTSCKDILPNSDVSRALRLIKSELRNRQQVDEQVLVDALVAASERPDDEKTVNRLQRDANRKLKTFKLDGIQFRPDRAVLGKAPVRLIQTTEGVEIKYPDLNAEKLVHREKQDNGGEIITITTDHIKEDKVVRT